MGDAGFKEAAIAVILNKADLVSNDRDWTYGWRAYDHDHTDAIRHSECKWEATEDSEMVEYSFSEFNDTFSPNTDKTVLSLSHAKCTCGKYKDVTIGIEGTVGELLQQILQDKVGIRRESRW